MSFYKVFDGIPCEWAEESTKVIEGIIKENILLNYFVGKARR
jgi:hypothetical protein